MCVIGVICCILLFCVGVVWFIRVCRLFVNVGVVFDVFVGVIFLVGVLGGWYSVSSRGIGMVNRLVFLGVVGGVLLFGLKWIWCRWGIFVVSVVCMVCSVGVGVCVGIVVGVGGLIGGFISWVKLLVKLGMVVMFEVVCICIGSLIVSEDFEGGLGCGDEGDEGGVLVLV